MKVWIVDIDGYFYGVYATERAAGEAMKAEPDRDAAENMALTPWEVSE